MTDRLHLQPQHRAVLEALVREHLPEVEVWAHGSRVHGRSQDGSDLELVLRGPGLKELPAGHVADFEAAVREAHVPFPVEACDWARLPEQFHREIERNHVVFTKYTTPNLRVMHKLRDITHIHKEQVAPNLHPTILFSHFSIPSFDAAGEPTEELGSKIKSNKFTVPSDAILVSRLNPEIVRVWEPREPRFHSAASTEFLVLRPKSTDRRFLKYLLLSPAFRAEMLARVTGTSKSHQRVRPDDALDIFVEVPPLPEQRAIAGLLGALDDQIELNRRMNETLEAMARAIFQDWFVDFGPVRAKMEGRAPYLAPELWERFPDTFDGEGKPVGWTRLPLDKIANFLNGLALQKFPALDPGDSLPVIKIAELRAGITSKSSRTSYDVPDRYIVRDGDFLFSWSGSLLAKFWTEGEGALNQHLFKVTSERFPPWFVSQSVLHHLEEFQAIAASKATTMGHIQRRHLKEATTTFPSDGVLSLLGPSIGPLIEHTIKNKMESRKLAETRDLLLPKLMSGEIRLRDAERAVKAVA